MKKLQISILAISFLFGGIASSSYHNETLQNIWNSREDLQATFPDGFNGNGWTLLDWAKEHGWKEETNLKQFNEDYEREYIYQKYLPLERALDKISSKQYTEEYHCSHFSDDLRTELEVVGIQTLKVNGDLSGSGHWWVAIQIEPITGEFASEDYEVRRVDSSNKKFLELKR